MPRQKKPTLKKRKDGRYKCVYNGRQFYGSTPEEAFAARDAFIENEKRGFQRMTVADYALPWLKRTYPEVAESTYTGLAIHIQHLIDEIGSKHIATIIPSDIKSVYSNQYKKCSNSYLKAAKQLYCSLFESAVADGLLRSNPAKDKTAKPHKGSEAHTRPITQQEREWILTLNTDHKAYPVVMTMLYAGLRPQEAKAIIIDRDVDFENDTIIVEETAHNKGTEYEYTHEGKNKYSHRTIPLFPPLKEALDGKTGYLVTNAGGERVNHRAWWSLWRSYCTQMEIALNGTDKRWYRRTKKHKAILAEAEALRKAGKIKEAEAKEGEIPPWVEFDIVPYSLRKSFCVMCRDAGVELNTCCKWMGHADSKMVLQVYDSVSEDRSEQERKKVEKRLVKVQKEVQTENEEPETVEK